MEPKNQAGFFNVIILPLFQAFTDVYPFMQPVHAQAKANCNYWVAHVDDGFINCGLEFYKRAMMADFGENPSLKDPHTELDGPDAIEEEDTHVNMASDETATNKFFID